MSLKEENASALPHKLVYIFGRVKTLSSADKTLCQVKELDLKWKLGLAEAKEKT